MLFFGIPRRLARKFVNYFDLDFVGLSANRVSYRNVVSNEEDNQDDSIFTENIVHPDSLYRVSQVLKANGKVKLGDCLSFLNNFLIYSNVFDELDDIQVAKDLGGYEYKINNLFLKFDELSFGYKSALSILYAIVYSISKEKLW